MTEPRVLLTGLGYGESPRWHNGRLWFCNWGTQEIVAVDEDGHSEVMARVPTTLPYSIDWLPDGRLIVIAGPAAALLVQAADGSLERYADLSGIAGGYNEIVVDGRGNIFVNGGDYDPREDAPFKPGIVAVVTPDGAARQVADGIHFGNGMAVTADNSTLIVAESYAHRLTAFEIGADGGLTNRRVWAELGEGVPPDGICIDGDGAVWYASVPNQQCVRVREGGEVLDTVTVDRGCFACMLGGPDGRTLFINAAEWGGMDNLGEIPKTGRVLVVDAPASGAGWPSWRSR